MTRRGIMVVMDAGIAAVLGAGVGTIGMIVTGWTARSATKMQMSNESLRERREPRRASYEAFSSAVATFHDHLQPWVNFGRLLDRSRTSGDEDANPVSYLKHSEFKDGYVAHAIALADEVSRFGRHVVLDGPAELEPFVTKLTELSSSLAAPFRILQTHPCPAHHVPQLPSRWCGCGARPAHRSRQQRTPGSLTWGFRMERVTRIELALSAWEADVLPLNYTRVRRRRSRRANGRHFTSCQAPGVDAAGPEGVSGAG